jgi:stage VI sporulation protein D
LKGGEDLTVENQSSIRFSVEESIWFQKGQEVSELLSMSLDPEITIQEHDQYISVRGGLVLTGEYHAQGTDEREGTNTVQPAGARTVQDVSMSEEGLANLRHKFPVDITIPKNRIQNLNDVYVSIESFDYELPQRGNLLIEAELSITGIYGDQQESKPLAVMDERDENSNTAIQEEVAETPQLDESTESAEDSEDEASTEVEHEEELVQPLMRGTYYEDDSQDVEEDENPFTPFVVEAKRDPFAEQVDDEEEETVEEVDTEEEQEQDQEAYVFTRQTPQFEFKSRVEETVNNQVNKQIDPDEDPGNRDENSLSLTKIFAKEEEEETTKLKMCIVQKDESIEAIADRYDVQTQTLIRVNNLDREHLAAGQILYIPVVVGSRK